MTPTTTITTTETLTVELSQDMIEQILREWAGERFDLSEVEIAVSDSPGQLGEVEISAASVEDEEGRIPGPEGFPDLDRRVVRRTVQTVALEAEQTQQVLGYWVVRNYQIERPQIEFREAGWGGLRAIVTRTVVT